MYHYCSNYSFHILIQCFIFNRLPDSVDSEAFLLSAFPFMNSFFFINMNIVHNIVNISILPKIKSGNPDVFVVYYPLCVLSILSTHGFFCHLLAKVLHSHLSVLKERFTILQVCPKTIVRFSLVHTSH